ETAKEQRGAAFHPPTLEMLATLDITDEILPIGVKVPVWQIRDRKGLIAEFDLGLLRDKTAFPFRFHLPQHLLSSALTKALRMTPARVEFGSRVNHVEEKNGRVKLIFKDEQGAEGTVE